MSLNESATDILSKLSASIPPISVDEWIQLVQSENNGKHPESDLTSQFQDLYIKPLFVVDKKYEIPISGSWKIACIPEADFQETNKLISSAILSGQDVVSLCESDNLSQEQILFICKEVTSSENSILLKLSSIDPLFISEIEKLTSYEKIIQVDPFNHSKAINLLPLHEKIKTIGIDGSTILESGGYASFELGYVCACISELIHEYNEKNMTPKKVLNSLSISLGVGTHVLVEIAKFRAMRVLWSQLLSDVSVDHFSPIILAKTSKLFLSKLDPHSNLLRSTLQTFSAIMGGADYIHTEPFDSPYQDTTEFSFRLARNTQLILRHESNLGKISDPLSGSESIESLTQQLVEKSWEIFLQIEALGGVRKAISSGWLSDQIKGQKEKTEKEISSGKIKLTGINQFPNGKDDGNVISKEKKQIYSRYAEPFEQLRCHFLKHPISVTIIPLSTSAKLRPRTEFCEQIFLIIGIQPTIQYEVENVFASDVVLFSGLDEDYSEKLSSVLMNVKKKVPKSYKMIAGKYSKLQLSDFGVDDCFYKGKDIVAFGQFLQSFGDKK